MGALDGQLELFDSAVFLEAVLNKDKSSEARSRIYSCRKANGKVPAVTHDILGEVNDVLHDLELFEDDYERQQALLNFKRIYDRRQFYILTPRPSKLVKSIDKVLDKDNRLDAQKTDCLIISKALCVNVAKIHTVGEYGWSLGNLIEIDRI